MRQSEMITAVFLAVKKYLTKTLSRKEAAINKRINLLDNKITDDGKTIAVELAKATNKAIRDRFETLSFEVDTRIRKDIPATVIDEINTQLPQEVSSEVGRQLSEIDWTEFYGDNGEDGLSAYDLWLQDNQGSIEDFYNALKGSQGFSVDVLVEGDRVGFKREDQASYTFTGSLKGIQGDKGEDGRSVEWNIKGDRVGFRYEGERNYKYTSPLTGASGKDGKNGVDGKSLEFIIVDDQIGVRLKGNASYEYTTKLTGKQGHSLEYVVEGDKVGFKRDDESDYTFTDSLKGKQGERGLRGYKGEKGNDGEKGDAPDHRWINGTFLQFEKPDGSWGQAVNLRGASGGGGRKGGIDLDDLPLSTDTATPISHIAVKQNDEWVKMDFNTFLTFLPTFDGTVVSINGDTVMVGDDEVIL